MTQAIGALVKTDGMATDEKVLTGGASRAKGTAARATVDELIDAADFPNRLLRRMRVALPNVPG